MVAVKWIYGCGINLSNQTNPCKVPAVVDDKLSRLWLLCCNSCCKNLVFSPTCVVHIGEEFWIGLRHGCLSHRALAFDMSNCEMDLCLCYLHVDASMQLIIFQRTAVTCCSLCFNSRSIQEDPTLGWWADVPVLSPQALIVNHALHGRNQYLSLCEVQEAQALTQILCFQVLWWWEWFYGTTLHEWCNSWESLCRSPWGELAKWFPHVHTWHPHMINQLTQFQREQCYCLLLMRWYSMCCCRPARSRCVLLLGVVVVYVPCSHLGIVFWLSFCKDFPCSLT